MQPDPTPDLDELERLHRDASSPGQIVTSHKMTVWEFDLCCESRNALPWLIRAARERDELRAELDALLHMPDASELPPPTPEQERRNAAIREIVLNPPLLAELRARAEKAEADLAESKRLVEKAEARVKELEIEVGEWRDGIRWRIPRRGVTQ